MKVIVDKAPGHGAPSDGGARSVWLRPSRTGRDEPPLTRTHIVEEAVALLDEEGIERLTMRRLAERLGVGATTLYWHVKTKDDVIDLAVDAIFGETPTPGKRAKYWRADIVALITGWRATLLRHPWSAALPSRQRPLIGPNFLAWMEFLQATLVRAGFTGQHIAAASLVLYNHVMGSAAGQSSLRLVADERRAGQEQLQAHRDLYPTLAENEYMLDDDWEGNFTAGLTYLLDGLEAQVKSVD